jgi:hypothetical protein
MKKLSVEQMENLQGGVTVDKEACEGTKTFRYIASVVCFLGSFTGIGALIFGPSAAGLLVIDGICLNA